MRPLRLPQMPQLPVTVSGLGLVMLVAGLAFTGGGWWFGWVEATVVGTGALAALGIAVVFTFGQSAYRIELDVPEPRVTVGSRIVGRIVVHNIARGRLLPARIELPVGRGLSEFPLPSLSSGASHEDLFGVPTTRRSVISVGPVRSVRGDPWGLVARRIDWTDAVQVHVHPRIVPLTGAAAGVLRDLEGHATQVVSDTDLSFHTLREYVPGDDRRMIHWRSTAHVGTLMVRQFEDNRRMHTAVALASNPSDYVDPDEFELAVAVAASIGAQTVRDGRDLTFLAGDGELRTSSPGTLLDEVSGLDLDHDARRSDHVVPWVRSTAPDASVVMLVTGSAVNLGDLRSAARALPSGVMSMIVSCQVGAESEVLLRGALSVLVLGTLDDLPRVLRQVVR
jgi:uncharacterized protein (DUF58 family)